MKKDLYFSADHELLSSNELLDLINSNVNNVYSNTIAKLNNNNSNSSEEATSSPPPPQYSNINGKFFLLFNFTHDCFILEDHLKIKIIIKNIKSQASFWNEFSREY